MDLISDFLVSQAVARWDFGVFNRYNAFARNWQRVVIAAFRLSTWGYRKGDTDSIKGEIRNVGIVK